MDHIDQQFEDLIAKGKEQGYLTYDDVNKYLPDEDISPEKLDNLILAIEELGLELVDEAPVDKFEDSDTANPAPSAEAGRCGGRARPRQPEIGCTASQRGKLAKARNRQRPERTGTN